MKKIFKGTSILSLITLFSIVVLILTACSLFTGTSSEKNNILPGRGANIDTTKKTLKIGWQYYNYIKKEGTDIDGQYLEYPYTDIYLSVKGEKEEIIKLGSYMGQFSEIKDFNNRELPESTLLLCESWYAGGGDDLCVVLEPGKKLSIQHRYIDQPQERGDTYEISKFKEIKEVSLPENAEILCVGNKPYRGRR